MNAIQKIEKLIEENQPQFVSEKEVQNALKTGWKPVPRNLPPVKEPAEPDIDMTGDSEYDGNNAAEHAATVVRALKHAMESAGQ